MTFSEYDLNLWHAHGSHSDVECKLSDTTLSPHLLAFQEALDVPHAIQLVREPGIARQTSIGGRSQWVVSADSWLMKLV
jgi:hypothetical protein